LDRDIFEHHLGLVLGLGLELLASISASSSLVLALASRYLASLTSLERRWWKKRRNKHREIITAVMPIQTSVTRQQ